MRIRFVIRLKKQWLFVWKLRANNWLNTRKNNGANKIPLKILRVKNKCLNLQPFRSHWNVTVAFFKPASLAQLARARDL